MDLSNSQISQPLGAINSRNQSGLILILSALSLCFVLFAQGLRVGVRLLSQKSWQWDDTASVAASVLYIAHVSIVFEEVHLGLGSQQLLEDPVGKHVSFYRLYYANNLFYVLTLLLSKLSTCLLFLRITLRHRHIRAVWTLIGVCLVWGLTAILLLYVRVSYEYALNLNFIHWLVVGILDAVTELLFVVMAAYLVAELQMQLWKKFMVVFAFAIRLPVIVALSIRLHYLNESAVSSATPSSLAFSLAIVCAQLQLSYSILAGSATVLKPFIAVYEPAKDTCYAPAYIHESKHKYSRGEGTHLSYHSYAVSHSQKERLRASAARSDTQEIVSRRQQHMMQQTPAPVEMDNLSATNRNGSTDSLITNDKPQLEVPNDAHYTTTGGGLSKCSSNGEKMVIRCQRDWDVVHELSTSISDQ